MEKCDPATLPKMCTECLSVVPMIPQLYLRIICYLFSFVLRNYSSLIKSESIPFKVSFPLTKSEHVNNLFLYLRTSL